MYSTTNNFNLLHLCRLLLLFLPLLHHAKAQSNMGSGCTTSDGHAGVCRLISECLNLRLGIRPEAVCGYKGTTPIVCCPIKNTSTVESTRRWPTWKIFSPNVTKRSTNLLSNILRPSTQMCAEYEQSVLNEASISRPNSASEFANVATPASHHFIVGGSEAELMEFPHMAAIGYNTKYSTINWDCGGTLISHRFVLTATHCTISPQWGDAQWVRLGDLGLVRDNVQPQVLRVIERIRHPNYRRPVKYNDIALLKLQLSVRFNAYVKPACLDTEENHPAGKMVLATGWGVVDWDNEVGSNNLLKVKLPIVGHSDCARFYADDTNRLPNGIDDRSQICAGENGKDTCQGDSGGPLVAIPTADSIDAGNLYTVIGVTSFGQLCGSISPGIYTRVFYYLPWIENIVWPDNSL